MDSRKDIAGIGKWFVTPVLTLLFFWLLLNGGLDSGSLVVGIAAALLITLLFGRGLAIFAEFQLRPRALVAALQFVFYFIGELVKSNIKLAGIVLSPGLPIKPGIVKVRTNLKSRMGRLLLANSITLTPGTLTVELEGEWLYVHWVMAESADIEAATGSIVAGFERYLEVMYG
ncbi:MAG: Na+/H+ antiporter subunit E [Xanthomonadales bacterium]|nr:Na+/H+ antiporter subunit E [Xanthomonadales bacterium]